MKNLKLIQKITKSPIWIPALLLLAVFLCLCIISAIGVLEEYTIGGITILLLIDYLLLFAVFGVILKKTHKRYGKTGSLACFFLSPIICFFIVDSLNTVSIFTYDLWTGVFNYLTYLSIHLLVYAITSRLGLAVIISACSCTAFGLINHFVMMFRGNPLLPWDVASVKTALSVAGSFKVEFTLDLFFSVALLLLLILTARRMYYISPLFNKSALHIVISRGIIGLVIGGYSFVLLGTETPKSFGVEEWPWRQNISYQLNGALTNFVINLKYLIIPKPTDYSVEKAQELVDEATGTVVTDGMVQPDNIVVIMNESFADLKVVGDFKTNEDYLPFFHSLAEQENTMTGNNYVSVHGGNTCNTEYEMLTGNPVVFLPAGSIAYQQYIKNPLTSIASLLQARGFSATALHPYYDTGWNRDTVYPLLGFDKFLSKPDWIYADYVRSFVSDKSNYDKIISEYEAKPAGEKSFFFNITMQNHSGYTDKDYNSTIKLQGMKGKYPRTEQYLSLLKQSDIALKNLLDYFQVQDEKTLVLFFGDHQPAIEDKFYEELYGKKLDDLSLAELQKRFATPYFLWANYDIPDKEYGDLSPNYLSTVLMETAGLELPQYQQFLAKLQKSLPVINANGYQGIDGNWYPYKKSSEYDELLNDYRILNYHNLFDKNGRTAEIFE